MWEGIPVLPSGYDPYGNDILGAHAKTVGADLILTIMDAAVNLLVAFDSDEREVAFNAHWKARLRGHGELGFALRALPRYLLRPWKWAEAYYLLRRKNQLFPEFRRPE